MKLASALAGLALLGTMAAAHASEIDVSYTVSGSAGNWVYDFSVSNNLGGTNAIYFFGVELLTPSNIVGSPGIWDPNAVNSLNSGVYVGGQGISYNDVWINGANTILSGQALSGFMAATTAATALSSVRWFAFSTNGTYTGSFCTMNCGAPFGNPGFEYSALQAVPSGVPAATLATVLESVHPNPFNPQAALAFTLAAAGPVRLAVYDLHGTKVNTLVDGDLPAGRHEAVWDGRDDRGQAMASGVYFYQLVANNFSQTKKMVLLK